MNARAVTRIVVNGTETCLEVRPGQTLLQVLRDELRLTGTKDGCGTGACGACTVLVGGEAVLACVTYALLVDEPVETVEGLAGEAGSLREAFADRGAFQCGFCTPGQIVRAVAVARQGGEVASLAEAMSGNLCRCTGYQPILEAVRDALGGVAGPGGA